MDESEERINDVSSIDKRIKYFPCDRFNDWGYSVKELGITLANGEYLCFPADDAYYTPNFVDKMSKQMTDYDLVYCDWIHDRADYLMVSVCPKVGYIDVGGFVVKKSLVSHFGAKNQESDGQLIEELVTKCRHKKLSNVMYVKN